MYVPIPVYNSILDKIDCYVLTCGEGVVLGGASANSDQTADTSGAQKTSPPMSSVTATMQGGVLGREEVVTTPNGGTPSTTGTFNDSYVILYVIIHTCTCMLCMCYMYHTYT